MPTPAPWGPRVRRKVESRKGESLKVDKNKYPLSIRVDEAEDHALITPSGYLNALTGDQIDKVCETLLGRGLRYFIIDFGEVELINTIGISILVGIIEKVLSHQGLVYFTGLSGTNREIIEVLDLGSVAMVFATVDAAREHLRRDRDALRRAMGE
jgi:anti-sigma B factor antagonist